MLKIYLDELSDMDLIKDVELAFGQCIVPNNSITRQIVKEVEHGELIDSNGFKDRYGYKLSISELSTGAKAAMLVALNPDKVVCFCEVGDNCRDYVIKNFTSGAILINYPTITMKYNKDEDGAIDVKLIDAGLRFNSIERLVQYFRNEFSFVPTRDEIEG